MKRITSILLVLVSVFLGISMLSSCSQVRKSRSRNTTQVDSSAQSNELSIKKTTVSERIDTNVQFNAGNLDVQFDSHDTTAQEFEADGYKVKLKVNQKGKSSLSVKGKNIKKPVQLERTITINAATSTATEVSVQQKNTTHTREKDVQRMPIWVWILGFGILILLIAYLVWRISK